MPDQPRAIYIDACAIMSYLTEDPNRIGVLRNVMDDAARTNRMVLYTSTLSIAEVAFIEADAATSLGGDDLEAIEDFWTQGPIRLVEANAVAMRAARDLLRALRPIRAALKPTHRLASLRSADAVHLGTALWLQADEFWTYDTRLLAWNPHIDGLTICEPWTPTPRLFE